MGDGRGNLLLRVAGGVWRHIRRIAIALLAILLFFSGIYVADYLASERLLPTVAPHALVTPDSRPCAEASMALVATSGVGRQTSYEMAAALRDVARDYEACVVILDYGSVMNTRGNVEAILAAVLPGRPKDAAPFPLVLLGNSAGGIEVQREANLFYDRYADLVRVVSVVADSAPSGVADLKPPLTQDLAQNCGLPLGHFMGQNIVRLWQAYEEASRRHEDLRDPEVIRRIQANTEQMQAKLTLSQLCMILEGYPRANTATPANGVPHVYVRPADAQADDVVRDAQAAIAIDDALGGGLTIVQVPGGVHAAAYLMWPVYESTYREIVRQAWIEVNPPPANSHRAEPV